MKTEIIKNPSQIPVLNNPDELQIVANPQPNTNTMATKTKTVVRDYKEQVKDAGAILGGQALAATANALVIPKVLGNRSATIQQVARIGLPAALGMLLSASKKPDVKKVALGFGVQGTFELIKAIIPDFNPAQGFAESSGYVYRMPPSLPAAQPQIAIPGWPGQQQMSPAAQSDTSQLSPGEYVSLGAEDQNEDDNYEFFG